MKHLHPEPVPSDDPQGVSEADVAPEQPEFNLLDLPNVQTQEYPD